MGIDKNSLLTVQEVANLLRVHKNTIYNMIHDGRLKAFRVGRAWRIKSENVEALDENHS